MTIQERNQQNAQQSTGPKTPEGKAKSAQNSRQHGLSSAQLYIPEGREDEFNALYEFHFADVRPVGELQTQFFEQLVHAAWNTGVARALLAVALHQMDDKKIANANRYLAQYERSYAKALAELRKLQTDLALRAVEQNEPIAGLPMPCQIKVIANEATKLARCSERTQREFVRFQILDQIGEAFRPDPLPATPETGPNQPTDLAA
jgi:hypothetical protein